MNFQQAAILLALPLASIPLIIHLINQRRFQTVKWGAMMFLVAANRLSRGYARIRQWLIMACRILALLGLILAVARPLASGWLGWAAGTKADTTLVLLDRSPSMQQTSASGGLSKLETARAQLASTLATLGSNRWLLIDGLNPQPRELTGPKQLADAALAEPLSTPADLPTLLEQARGYIEANNTGRTEVWIASDLRANDWDAEGGRWDALRQSFSALGKRVRFHLLSYPETAPGNLAVRVTDVRRRAVGETAELLLSLRITREGEAGQGTGPTGDRQVVPLQIELDGARSELTVELAGPTLDLKDHRVPLDTSQVRGWGRVLLPADANPADNDAQFVYDQAPARRTVVVSENPSAVRPFELAATISPESLPAGQVESLGPDQAASLNLDGVALLVWQAPLPEGETATQIEQYVDRGGVVVCIAPNTPTDTRLFAAGWTTWSTEDQTWPLETWRADADLLANSLAGQSLPVGTLEVKRFCGVAGELIPLASLRGGGPLLARVATTRGGVYFLATTAAPQDSNLATNGVVLYVLVQRALGLGASTLGDTRLASSGDPALGDSTGWQRLAGGEDAIATPWAYHRGIYLDEQNQKLYALNRPVAEDQAAVLADNRVDSLFDGLEFRRVSETAGNRSGLVQEIWRLFLGAMLIALVGEAALCLPSAAKQATIELRGGTGNSAAKGAAA
jgi:hypothetical protein